MSEEDKLKQLSNEEFYILLDGWLKTTIISGHVHCCIPIWAMTRILSQLNPIPPSSN